MRGRAVLGTIEPILLCGYDVDVETVFDATDPAELRRAGIDASALTGGAWRAEVLRGATPASQALATRLIEVRYAGLLARSFASGASGHDRNQILWRPGSRRSARVLLVDDHGRLHQGQRH